MKLATAIQGCVLRPWVPADKASLIANANNRNVWRNLADVFPHPYTDADADAWFQIAASPGRSIHFAIELDGAAVGGIGAQDGRGNLRAYGALRLLARRGALGEGCRHRRRSCAARIPESRRPLRAPGGAGVRVESVVDARARETRIRARGRVAQECHEGWPTHRQRALYLSVEWRWSPHAEDIQRQLPLRRGAFRGRHRPRAGHEQVQLHASAPRRATGTPSSSRPRSA